MNRRRLVACGSAAVVAALPSWGQYDSFCAEIAKVIAMAEKIEPGMKRSDLERDWQRDGGLMAMLANERYVLRRCNSIKINVDFEEGSGRVTIAPSDVVRKVSDPYLQTAYHD